MASLIKI